VKAFEQPERTARRRRLLRNPDAIGGSEWVIREMDTGHLPGAKANGCLICESAEDGVVRRVWDYPEHWYQLPDEELRRLCEK
jgi:hypothetical protein